MIAAAAIAMTLLAWGAGVWLGMWLNRRLKLAPWPGPRWATRIMSWSVRCFLFLIAFEMVSAPVTYLAYALSR